MIKFIMVLKGFSYLQALRYLSIGKTIISAGRCSMTREQRLIEQFRKWEKDYYIKLTDKLHNMMSMKKRIVSPEDMEKLAWIFDEIQKTEYHLDILFDGHDQEIFDLFKEVIDHDI